MKTEQFKALMLEQDGASIVPHVRALAMDALPDGDVLVRVHYSGVNFKDAMALGNKGIIRKFPAIAGIDFSGVVVDSSHADFKSGDDVVLTGWGVGERHWGGYAEYARVNGDWLIHRPPGLSLEQAMQVGTAGFTAMLCVDALQAAHIDASRGPVVVTGASGGVGSVALMLLAKLGYEAWALTGRMDRASYLTSLGATRVVPRDEYLRASKPGRQTMESETFAAAIDTVGGDVLQGLIARVSYGGAIAACGLVGGANLDTTVYPFILRGIRLLGIDSVRCPKPDRLRIWNRIAAELPLDRLAAASRRVELERVPSIADELLRGHGKGRTVVDLRT
jgi:acrylyl-CoA reductase (NADPH)